jgi:uncharacterized NAD(P)/FAD-binding protein YdhS
MRTQRSTTSRGSLVAIVGGGFCGTMVAVNLARRAAARPLKIVIFERGERIAKGAAYGTTSPHHLLNVPAGHMSAFPDLPGDFLRWLRARDPDADAATFAPRRLYGEYLEETLFRVAAESAASIAWIREEIVDLHETGSGVVLVGRDGSRTRADRAVLALGHAPPALPVAPCEADELGQRYVENPWSADPLDGLGPDDRVILLGSGLTAVDVIADARARGHRGTLTAISRHGLLPCGHRSFAPVPVNAFDVRSALTTKGVLRHFRTEGRRIEREGGDWRGVFDSLRGDFPAIWNALSDPQKARFLRHLVPFWDIHRHRVAPEIANTIETAQRDRQLHVLAGRPRSIEPDGDEAAVTFTPRGQTGVQRLRAKRVINCTGPGRRIAPGHSPLVDALLVRRLARPDVFALGLSADEKCAIVDASGEPSRRVFALGPVLKGGRWETTAVRELRGQANDLAVHLLELAAAPPRTESRVA